MNSQNLPRAAKKTAAASLLLLAAQCFFCPCAALAQTYDEPDRAAPGDAMIQA